MNIMRILRVATLGVILLVTGASTSVAQSLVEEGSGATLITENRYLGLPLSEYDSRVSRTYLGRLNANRYDPESVANPYGRYGSRYSSASINNPYSAYGSRYSNQSARNPYATEPPRVLYD
jgi:hypothetical protein